MDCNLALERVLLSEGSTSSALPPLTQKAAATITNAVKLNAAHDTVTVEDVEVASQATLWVQKSQAVNRIAGAWKIRQAQKYANALRTKKSLRNMTRHEVDAVSVVREVWERFKAKKHVQQRRTDKDRLERWQTLYNQILYEVNREFSSMLASKISHLQDAVVKLAQTPMAPPQELIEARRQFKLQHETLDKLKMKLGQNVQYTLFLQGLLMKTQGEIRTKPPNRIQIRIDAARRIQRAWRKYRLKKQSKLELRERRKKLEARAEAAQHDGAAVMIQRMWRQYKPLLDRKRSKVEFRDKRKFVEAIAEDLQRTVAAKMVQRMCKRWFQKRKARKALTEAKKGYHAVARLELRTQCAIVIQKIWRGHRVRKQHKKLKPS